jgi:class 3 adenylate cyclase
VIAGVIGQKKYVYEVWGDCVNTASRMESHGLPGCIQVTAAAYERLRDRYTFVDRGSIEVKSIGAMTTYLLTGQREIQ